MNKLRRRKLLAALLVCLAASVVNPAAAQANFPARPIRLINAYAAGSASDTVARAIGLQNGGEVAGLPVHEGGDRDCGSFRPACELQLEAKAHIEVQRWIDEGNLRHHQCVA